MTVKDAIPTRSDNDHEKFCSVCFHKVCVPVFFLETPIVDTLGSAYALQDWKQEYAAVCAKTQNAMLLSADELKEYIERCDTLQASIDQEGGLQGATERKIYAKG